MTDSVSKHHKRIQFEVMLTSALLQTSSSVLQLLSDASPAETPLSRTEIKQAMQKGALWYKAVGKKKVQRLRRLSRSFNVDDCLYLYYDPHVLAQQPNPATLISDEGDYSIWYKPYGMYAQGSKWGDHCTITRWAEAHLKPQRPAFIVHRLDRATSGLIIVAHKKSAAAALSSLFEHHQLTKVYHALVHGEFHDNDRPMTIEAPIEGRSACSHVSLLAHSKDHQYSLVSVRIDTGRKHQIRRHLSGAGYPIVGDRLHGSAESDTVCLDLQLVASELAFNCPISGKQQFFSLPVSLQQKLI